jgi:tetratricopeptide (TPR) repeat protein
MVSHDRALAHEAFEAALAISPSTAAAYMWGALNMGWSGEAERAIEWGERGIRLSPMDAWMIASLHGMFLGHFLRRRYDEAATAARRAIRSKPGFSISHMMLAAALSKLGRVDEATAAAGRSSCNLTSAAMHSASRSAPRPWSPNLLLRRCGPQGCPTNQVSFWPVATVRDAHFHVGNRGISRHESDIAQTT